MCLTAITTQDPKKLPKGEVTAWKIFHIRSNGYLHSQIMGVSRPRRLGVWYQASKVKVREAFPEEYISGFHAFISKEAAIAYGGSFGLRKVKLRGVRVLGFQGVGRPCYVADEMMVLGSRD